MNSASYNSLSKTFKWSRWEFELDWARCNNNIAENSYSKLVCNVLDIAKHFKLFGSVPVRFRYGSVYFFNLLKFSLVSYIFQRDWCRNSQPGKDCRGPDATDRKKPWEPADWRASQSLWRCEKGGEPARRRWRRRRESRRHLEQVRDRRQRRRQGAHGGVRRVRGHGHHGIARSVDELKVRSLMPPK